ncbi:MAG: hypothetical protein Q8P41_18515 [Pseudomonadota bacterium]|nr:hypothetical protein [Pseudomonadota bacterium]
MPLDQDEEVDEAREFLRVEWASLPPHVRARCREARSSAARVLVGNAVTLFSAYGYEAEPEGDRSWKILATDRSFHLVIVVDYEGDLRVSFERNFVQVKLVEPLNISLTYDPALGIFFGRALGRTDALRTVFQSPVTEIVRGFLGCLKAGPPAR